MIMDKAIIKVLYW